MHLNRLHLDGFGVLVEDDFDFQPGLNLILGPNEAGKSTLQHALLTMLYGFYQSDRITSAEKKAHARYRPWVGSQYGGSLTLSLNDDSKYLIVRRFDSPEPETHLYIANTGAEVTNQFLRKRRGYIDFCERQLGLSRQVFAAVACVQQGQMSVIAENDASTLSDAIIRLFDSASTDVSVRMVLDRLATAIRAVGTEKSRSGPWFRAKQAIADGQAAIEQRKSLTLSLETDYHRASQLQQELQELNHEVADLNFRLQRIELTELQHILHKHEQITEQQKMLEAQLHGIADASDIAPAHRDQVLRLMEERKHIRKRRQELFAELDSCEKTNKSCQSNLEALPVGKEFWYGDGPVDFLALKRQWQRQYIRVRENKLSQENLQRAFGDVSTDDEQAQIIQQLDAEKIDEIRKMATTVSEQQEYISANEQEMASRQRYLRLSRIAVSVGLLLILGMAAIVQMYPALAISVFISQSLPNSLEYLAAGIIAMWLAFEGASLMSIKTLQDDHRNAQQNLRLMQHEMRELLAPYNVKSFDELLNLKLRLVDMRKAGEEVSISERTMEDVNRKMRDWLSRFGFEQVSQENVNRVETIIHEGRRQMAQMQKLVEEIAEIDAELASKDERLAAVTRQIKSRLEEAGCWTDNIEDDAERFIYLADAVRTRVAVSRELDQLKERDRELLKGHAPEDIRKQLEVLKKGLRDEIIEPDIQSKKTIRQRLEEVKRKINDVSLELATIRERISERENRMPDLSEIEETIVTAQNQIDELVMKRRALELAFETLSEVAHQAHRDFAPQLAKQVGTLLSNATDHRYHELYIDPANFAVRIAHGKARTLVPAELLSYGTREQLYLLMRAAIAQLFSNNGETVPLFLDDPLTHADDKRRAAVLRTIAEIARQQQVFYFTKDQGIIDHLTYDDTEYNLMTLRPADDIRQQTRRATTPIIRIEEGDL